MKISLSVPPIWKAQKLSCDELLKNLRECGFEYLCEEFDLNTGAPALLNTGNSGIKSVKARVVTDKPEENIASIIDAIALCGKNGINELVIPLAAKEENNRWEYFALNKDYIEKLLPAAQDNGVKLLIEGMGNYQSAHFIHSAPELNYFYEMLGCPWGLGFNLNIGNQGLIDANLYSDTRGYGKNLCSIDASDNFFAMPLGVNKDRENLAIVPLTGFLDFDESFIALKEIGYDGVYNLRLNSPRVFDKTSPYVNEPKLSVMPLSLLKRHYAWAYKVTRHMLTTYGYTAEGSDRA